MTDGDTARLYVDRETRDRVNDRKRGDETQDDVIRRLLDGSDRVTTTGDDPLAMYEDFREVVEHAIAEANGDTADLDSLRDGVATIEERTGQIQRQLEELSR